MDMAPSHSVLHQVENSAPGIKASIYRSQARLVVFTSQQNQCKF